MGTSQDANEGVDPGVVSVQIVGAMVVSRAIENLLQAQPGFVVFDGGDAAATGTPSSRIPQVILILGRDGQAVLQRRQLRSVRRRRQERFVLLSNSQDIDFRLARELSIRVFVGADEPVSVFLQALREAAVDRAFCSPQMVPILLSATSPTAANAMLVSKEVPDAAVGEERGAPRSVARANRPAAPPLFHHSAESAENTIPNSLPAQSVGSGSGGSVLSEEMRRALRLGLSTREAVIALQASQGLSNQQIADSESITLSTVKFHLYRTYQKLGIKRRSELTRLTSPVEKLSLAEP